MARTGVASCANFLPGVGELDGAAVAGEDVLVRGDAVADSESELASVPGQVGWRDVQVGGDVGDGTVVVFVLLVQPGGVDHAENLSWRWRSDSVAGEEFADALVAVAGEFRDLAWTESLAHVGA